MKQLAGILFLALAAWLMAVLFLQDAPEAPTREFTSSAQCQACHAAVYAEWSASWHSKSWIDQDVRAQSNDFANTDCIDCHAPRPVFETGVGKRVLPRSARRNEGVDCIACHALPAGGMAGTISSKSAACRPTATVELQRPEYCGVCHDQHKTVQQWLTTSYADNGVSCIDCHMPYRDGDPNKGRSHVFPGAHDLDLIKSAVELRGGKHESGDGYYVEVENVAAGHAYPTDERSRSSDIFWRPLATGTAGATADSQGAGDWRFLHRIRDPYRTEVDIPSTLLMFGENRRLDLQGEGTAGAVEIALVYKLTPYFRDPATGDPMATETVTDPFQDSQLVHRIVLQP
jgi:hypothetical protein